MPELARAVPTATEVAQVRAFNRFYTSVIGVVHGVYLDTPYTLTEGRLLFELAQRDVAAVSWLRQVLDIDAGYLSRVLSRFAAEGLVTRHRAAADARRQDIKITAAGRSAVADLDARAARQVTELLAGVDVAGLLGAMQVITRELGGTVPAATVPAATVPAAPGADGAAAVPAPRMVTLRPPGLGDLGWALQRHAAVYAAEFGWNADFEAVCATILAEFVAKRDSDSRRTAGWIAEVDGRPAGCVFCVPDTVAVPSDTHQGVQMMLRMGHSVGVASPGDNHAPDVAGRGKTARLRLLLVEPWARGLGLGSRLVAECLQFAREAGYDDIILWTYDRLAAARRIYQAAGFTLVSEHAEEAFGHQMMSQTWRCSLIGGTPSPLSGPGREEQNPLPRDSSAPASGEGAVRLATSAADAAVPFRLGRAGAGGNRAARVGDPLRPRARVERGGDPGKGEREYLMRGGHA
jgi:DNA-binding MarR family transcriptional regulator/ribosomal protein S18 acetylase RimI-like enzyme